MLPKTVHHVFLSATIPNALEFAKWICHTHSQPCHVVSTDYRPTPLQHYLFPSGGEGIYLVIDEKSRFKEDNFHKALAVVADAPAKDKGKKQKGKGSKGILEKNLKKNSKQEKRKKKEKKKEKGFISI